MKDVHIKGEGVFRQQWMYHCTTNYTILDNYCNVPLPNSMAQKWTKLTALNGIRNLELNSNFYFHMLVYF